MRYVSNAQGAILLIHVQDVLIGSHSIRMAYVNLPVEKTCSCLIRENAVHAMLTAKDVLTKTNVITVNKELH